MSITPRASFEPAQARGERYQALVPDTLDLAARCRLALQGIANTSDPDCYGQMWFTMVYACRQPYLAHNGADPVCTPKYAEALPMLRTACGSQEHLALETEQMAHLLDGISPDDGLYYCRWQPDRPWHSNYMPHVYEQTPEDIAQVAGVGRMMRAMLTWRERDGDSRWDEHIRAMARGLGRIAIKRDGYAYYPDGGHSLQYAYPRSGWLHTQEPESDTESGEGSVLDSLGHPIYALARWYAASGDEQALDLAGRLARFATLPKMWGGLAEEVGVHGGEQGHFHAHPHGHMGGLRGLLAYGAAAHDARILEFVRRSYEHLRTYMIPRAGWLPGNGIGDGVVHAEGCNLGDLVALGVRMSDLGLGDYWEDVDAVVRNLLMEQQLTDVEALRVVSAASPPRAERSAWPGQETSERMPERLLGAFTSWGAPNRLPVGSIMGCCVANASLGLAFAWEGALRCQGDTAQINLLVNRASRLADVDSYLPYEGKVVVHNKAARRIALRVLSWIDRRTLALTVGGLPRPIEWVGSYLLVDDLKPGDEVVMRFAVPESTVSYTANHRVWRQERVYTITLRGSTIVAVSPEADGPRDIPIYRRAHLRSDQAPMVWVDRFVPERELRSW